MAVKKKAKKKTKTEIKANFKKGIAKAKAIHKKSPGKKWHTCLKEGFKKK